MSYIEEKYNKVINEIFEGLKESELNLINLFERKSLGIADEVAKICAATTKQINLILKKYYPEIIKMDYKIEIKSSLKFYFDLIDKLTDFIRHCEQLDRIDENYYDVVLKFLKEKDSLIAGKYRNIVTQELTNFYDEKSRNVLEKIIAQKFALRERNFFMFANLEEEIRKVAKLAGADYIRILKADDQAKTLLDSAKSIIRFYVEDDEKSNYVKKEIRDFLESKNYLVQENKDSICTNANLFQE